MKVLLVDDEPWFTDGLVAALESRRLECITATDMTGGVEVLKGNRIDVLVTDIMMPSGKAFPEIDANESGFQFIEYVQRHWPQLPIVCLSVIADQAKIRFLTRKGVRYLRKGETPLSTAVEVILAVGQGRIPRVRP